MPGQRTPAASRLGGVITRRHAALLLQSGADGGDGVCVKDLRIRRVVPPTSASLDSSSPECAAGPKPGPVESTPPEAVPAAGEELERKPVLPRSKLVRDPGSFGYRRLLPFLNQMSKNDDSSCKDMSSENTSANSAKGLKRSRIWLLDESTGGGGGAYRESDPLGSAEPMVVQTVGGSEMKVVCDIVGEKTNIIPHDLAGSKPFLARCTKSRFVHHQSSFSYKRMLPFLMENEISSQEGERVKIRRVAEDMHLTPDENDVSASRRDHLAASEDASNECESAQIGNIGEEKPSNADENHVLENRQLQSAVLKASSPEDSSVEVQNVIQEEGSVLNQDPLAICEGESTSDVTDVLADGLHLLPVSEDSPEEYSRDVAKTIVPDKAFESDERHALEPNFSETSPMEDGTSEVQMAIEEHGHEMQKVTEEQPLTSDGHEGNTLTSVKGEFLAKEKPQLSDTKELLTAQVEDTAEFPQVPRCQSSDLGCPTNTVISSLNRCSHSLEHLDAVASLDDRHIDAVMICRSSDPCPVDRCLSVEEMSGSTPCTDTGSSKVHVLSSPETLSLGKRGLSPKKLSPKRGILKRHTRGCKGICMCLDCSTFRLHADRAFEFSRKQMHEADDIIGNLLKEMANLRSLVQKPAGHRESIQAACQRAFQVEEVARDRCHQMFVDLNSHCKIPGPRVKFAQYVEEKLGSSPRSSKHLEDNMGSSLRSSKHLEDKMGSSPRSSSFNKRRCMKS